MSKPILYTCPGSRGQRATWAAEEAGLKAGTDYELQLMPFPPRYTVENYLEINSVGTVPAMVQGDMTMSESCAIAVFLAGMGNKPELLVERDEPDYGAFLDFTYHADATITFPQTVYLRFCRFEKDRGLQDAGEAYAHWFIKRLAKVEQRLESREFLCADRFTIADVCVGYALILADMVGIDGEMPASVKEYRSRLTARDGYKRAVALENSGPEIELT